MPHEQSFILAKKIKKRLNSDFMFRMLKEEHDIQANKPLSRRIVEELSIILREETNLYLKSWLHSYNGFYNPELEILVATHKVVDSEFTYFKNDTIWEIEEYLKNDFITRYNYINRKVSGD